MMQVIPSELSSVTLQDIEGAVGQTVAPAADEVSLAVTEIFNQHASLFAGLVADANIFQQDFTSLLSGAAAAYQDAEVAALQALWNDTGSVEQQLLPEINAMTGLVGFSSAPALPWQGIPATGGPLTLVYGGTTMPVGSPWYSGWIQSLFSLPGTAVSGYTPEQAWPLTPSLGSMPFGQSFAAGVPLMNSQIMAALAGNSTVTVWTVSQSSTVATLEIRNLMATGSPGVGRLSFVLTGDPNNPNGGALERFTGLYIPGLDVPFNGGTPPNSPYPTTIYTNQYDGVSDFPQYPLNVVSDANALAGFAFGDHYYGYPASQYTQLPTSPGYTGNTSYMFRLSQDVPLLQPLRSYIPAPYGNAVADLLTPDLRVLVDMGYGTGEYANIPTPGSLFELPDPFTILPDLAVGAIQGPQAFLSDLGAPLGMPTGYPFNPVVDPGLNYPLPQTGTTGLSLLTTGEGTALGALGLVPPWDVSQL